MKIKTILFAFVVASVTLFAVGCGEDGNTSGSAESMGMISDAEHDRSKAASDPIESAVSDVISSAGDLVSDVISGAGDLVSDIVSGAENGPVDTGSRP